MAGTGSLNQRLCECKVGRNIARYKLKELNENVVQFRREQGISLRDLAAYINKQILKSALENTSEDILDEERDLFGALEPNDAVAAIYEVLQDDDDVSPARQARVRTRLQQAGVNLEKVEDHWVTHTTVRRHLNECLEIDTSSSESIDGDSAKRTTKWIRTRCKAIIDRTFERLQSAEELRVQDIDISVSIRATCTECGATYSPTELISRGHCDCYLEMESA